MVDPPVIPPQALNVLQMNVEVSWAPAFLNARADLPPNFILFSIRPRRGGNWVESRNPPGPFNWAVPAAPRNVPPQQPHNHQEEREGGEERNHEEEAGEHEGNGEERVGENVRNEEDNHVGERREEEADELELEEENRRVTEDPEQEEEEVVVIEDESHEEEEVSEAPRSVGPGEYYGEPNHSEGSVPEEENEYREEYREVEEGEEEVTIVEEITEEQIFGPRSRNIPFTVFGPDGLIANPEDFILVESDESPTVNHSSSSESLPRGVLITIT